MVNWLVSSIVTVPEVKCNAKIVEVLGRGRSVPT